MREFLNKNGAVIFLVVIVLTGGIWFFFMRGTGAPNFSKGFFVDDETGEEMVLDMREFPPRTNPKTGKQTMVQEFKYSCDGGKTVKVGYYLKYTAGTKQALEKQFAESGRVGGLDVSQSTWVRSPEKGSKWLQMGSPEALPVTKISCPNPNDIETALPN